MMKMKNKFNLRYLRITLKYRPDILKFILKLKACNDKRKHLIKKLTKRLQLLENDKQVNQYTIAKDTEFLSLENSYSMSSRKETYTQCEILSLDSAKDTSPVQPDGQLSKVKTKDASTQYEEVKEILVGGSNSGSNDEPNQTSTSSKNKEGDECKGWNINEDKGLSIAEQVKEVAQNALQQSGMVYVESAGMYYDYKTGYYYHAGLGLYYHTDTGCYYYYSDKKKEFVFHSYPDRSAVAENSLLAAHERRKARKQKKVQQREDVDNLTKNMAKDKEDEATKPKRKKLSEKAIKQKKNENGNDETCKSSVENDDLNKTKPENDSKETDTEIASEKERSDENNKVESSKEALEDGECSETESEHEEDDTIESDASTATDDSVVKHQPPCMRVIVRETSLPKLKVGTLFLVTKDGGTVGREGDHHAILLRDSNVSRNHLNIIYDMDRRMYLATDLGSKNGTLLNGVQMSESQVVSKEMQIVHGSTIQLGETKLLCHIHPGNDTCGHCEPGLIMETLEKEKVAYTRTCSVKKQHELELARLKNKYKPAQKAIEATAYRDRAQQRRETAGSSHHAEKTLTADVNTYIAPENKGFKMLEKMGWSKGEGLGKDSQGDTEPVPLVSNEGKAGMGAAVAPAAPPGPKNTLGPATMRLAAKSKLLQPPAKAFQQDDDDDEGEE